MTKNHDSSSHATETADALAPRRRRWFRRLLRWTIRLVVLAVVLLVLVQHVASPIYWRWATKEFMEEYWSGPIQIQNVNFDLHTGTVVLRGMSLRDPAGREWVHVDEMTYYLRNWPSLRPTLYEIKIEQPAATVYLDDGQVNIPITPSALPWAFLEPITREDRARTGATPPAEPSAPSKTPGPLDMEYYINIEKTILDNISLVVVESDSHFLRGKIQPTTSWLFKNLRFYGTASATGDIVFTYGQCADTHAKAEFHVHLSRLVIEDLRKLLHQPPLKNGQATKPLVLKDLRMEKLTYDNGKLDIPRVNANVGNGSFGGNLKMVFHEDEDENEDAPWTFAAAVQARRIPLQRFYDAYDPTQEVTFGYVTALIDDIRGTSRDLRDLEMDGAVFMDDADLDRVRVVGNVFDAMHVREKNIREGSDLRVIFELKKGVMTLAQARLGNNLVAVMAEPNGTVDIVDREMNLRVIGAALNDLGKIPLIGWIANMTNQLTALRVTGDWSDPKIQIEPLRNVTSSMFSFFQDAARTGGELTGLNDKE